MERRGRKGSSSARSEEMERAGDRDKKYGLIFFDRPKPTAGCSANGRRKCGCACVCVCVCVFMIYHNFLTNNTLLVTNIELEVRLHMTFFHLSEV
jgi:hypothetical protein